MGFWVFLFFSYFANSFSIFLTLHEHFKQEQTHCRRKFFEELLVEAWWSIFSKVYSHSAHMASKFLLEVPKAFFSFLKNIIPHGNSLSFHNFEFHNEFWWFLCVKKVNVKRKVCSLFLMIFWNFDIKKKSVFLKLLSNYFFKVKVW